MSSEESGTQDVPQGVDPGADIGSLLKKADRYVKERKYEEALAVIRTVREQDGQNLYAEAYEARVRALMNAQQPAAVSRDSGATDKGTVIMPGSSSPVSRQDALLKTLATILARVRELRARKEYDLALEEVARARLLAPANADTLSLEKELRTERDAAEKTRVAQREEQIQRGEQQRIEILRRELARIQREKEERRSQQEETRKRAQEEKLLEGVQAVRSALAGGLIDDAKDQVRFLRVLDPSHPEVGRLDGEIAAAETLARKKLEEQQHRKAIEEQQRREAMAAAVRRFVEMANQFAVRGDFAEALRTITRAYLLDPMNAELKSCERDVLALRDRAARVAREQEEAKEAAERKQREEELQRMAQAEQERLLEHERKAVENEERQRREELGGLVAGVRAAMAKDDTTAALEGIARAFKLDPFDPEVAALEKEIRLRQARKKIAVERAPSGSQDPGVQVAAHLDRAEESFGAGEYDSAFDELTKAMSIDPLNARARELERRITGKLMAAPAAAPQSVAAPVDRGAPALDDTISAFRRTLDELSVRPAAGGPALNPVSPNAECIARAERLLGDRAFDEALAEIAIALVEHPDDPALREMESRIWEERDRQAAPGSGPATPLRLIHPRKSAAGPNG